MLLPGNPEKQISFLEIAALVGETYLKVFNTIEIMKKKLNSGFSPFNERKYHCRRFYTFECN